MPIIYEPKGRAREYALWAANIYSGCVHGCRYCFAPDAIRRERTDFHKNVLPRKNIKNSCKKKLKSLQLPIKVPKYFFPLRLIRTSQLKNIYVLPGMLFRRFIKLVLFVSILTKVEALQKEISIYSIKTIHSEPRLPLLKKRILNIGNLMRLLRLTESRQ